MTVTFRRLETQDAGAYRAIRLECLLTHPEMFGTTYAEESAVAELRFERFIRDGHPDNFMLGAFADDELIGIAGFERFPRIKARHKGELVQMYVKREFTGRDIGLALVNCLLETCFSNPEIEEVKLSVVADNLRAVRFYEKAGFRTYATEKNYFKADGHYRDQLFMKKGRQD